MIKAILIDIDDTLLDFNACSRDSLLKACNETGIPFSEALADKFFEITTLLWKKVEKNELKKTELYKIRFNIVFKQLGINGDGEAFEKIFHAELVESCVKISGADELLQTLSDKYILCAASNAPYHQQINRLTKAGLINYFTEIFVSERIGHEKPSKEFFDYILTKLGLSPHETLIIGDSITADIIGGIQSGLHTCYFSRNDKTPTGDILPEFTVYKLNEIPKISLLA